MKIPFEINKKFKNQIKAHFDSSEACYNYIFENYPYENYFYRGESRFYERSTPGMVRILTDPNLHFQEQSMLQYLTENFEDWCKKENLELDKGQMFLQHYGLPTDLLDITSSLKIGLYFAFKDHPKEIGYLATIEKSKAFSQFEIFNLSDYSFLKGTQLRRPKLQEAYAIRHKTGDDYDLKQSELIASSTITWFSFTKTEEDEELFSDLPNLLDNTSDEIVLFLSAYISDSCLSTWQDLNLRIQVCEKLLNQVFK